MAIANLTCRQLTDLSDFLNAFAGIANLITLQEARNPSIKSDETQNLTIMPLHFTNEGDLLQILSWDWYGTLIKRPGVDYPSWHWSA